jgi:O-antigen/teichoic acid export membrane protein
MSRNLSAALLGQGTARVISGIATVATIRLLSPVDYGAFTFVQSLVLIGSTSILQGINFAVVRWLAGARVCAKTANDVAAAGALLTLVATLVAATLMALIAHGLGARGYSDRDRLIVASYVACGIATSGLAGYGLAYSQATQAFVTAGFASTVQGLALLLGTIAVGRSLTWHSATAMFVVAPLAALLVTSTAFSTLRSASWSGLIGAIRQMLPDAMWYASYTTLLAVGAQLDVIMMYRYTTLEEVGTYGVAARFFGWVLFALGAVHSVLLPKLAADATEQRLREIMRAYTRKASAVAALVVLTVVFADSIVNTIAGSNYQAASWPFRILMLCAAFSIVLSPSVNVLITLQRGRQLVTGGVVLLVTTLLGHLILTSQYGAIGAATTTAIGFTSMNALFWIWAQRTDKDPIENIPEAS